MLPVHKLLGNGQKNQVEGHTGSHARSEEEESATDGAEMTRKYCGVKDVSLLTGHVDNACLPLVHLQSVTTPNQNRPFW